MTTLREAAQQALEALIHMCHNTLADKGYDGQLAQDAIDGLKGALAQQEQEDIAQNLQSRLDAALLLEERRQEVAQFHRGLAEEPK